MSEIFQLFECGDVFQFTDPADSYQTWQGLRGPKGDKGDTGATGPGLDMQGPVATTGDLPATAPSNELWLVGAAAPYHGWFYNGASWEDAGEVAVGPEGPPGQDGADGAAATIEVGTVSGLPAGSTPTVTNSGSSSAAVFNFGIPAGADGAPGQDGAPGPGVAAGGTPGQVLVKQSSTDYDTAWEKPKYYRPNLLDNWYFLGGGSQQGAGNLPINQRGQTSYSSSGYTIDRWRIWASAAIALTDDGMSITASTDNFAVFQYFPTKTPLLGKTVTISALLSDGTLLTATGNISKTQNSSITSDTVSHTNINLWVNQTGSYPVGFQIHVDNGYSATVVAAKVEIGPEQTLAHQESGVWVLNEVPDYLVQLQRCRQYLAMFSATNGGRIAATGKAASFASGNRVLLVNDVPMVAVYPTSVSFTGAFQLVGYAGGEQIKNAESIDWGNIRGTSITLAITTENGFSQDSPCASLTANPACAIYVSCEL